MSLFLCQLFIVYFQLPDVTKISQKRFKNNNYVSKKNELES